MSYNAQIDDTDTDDQVRHYGNILINYMLLRY